jgi:hypothetical protein
MSKIEHYRKRAKECMREARDSSNASDKALLQAMAKGWFNIIDLVSEQDEATRERRRQRRLQRRAMRDNSEADSDASGDQGLSGSPTGTAVVR